jgi:phosphoribosylformylglycinamidine (FGAM) synthase PurS component
MKKCHFLVFIKEELYDPQSEVVLERLRTDTEKNAIFSLRQGKIFAVEYDEKVFSSAQTLSEHLSQLLVNPNIERGQLVEL